MDGFRENVCKFEVVGFSLYDLALFCKLNRTVSMENIKHILESIKS